MLFLLILSQIGYSQKMDSTIHFLGTLYDANSYKPIKYAHIINIDNNRATISDTLGNFDIKLKPGDSLMITSIGYQEKFYQYTGEWQKVVFENIPLKERIYKISKVEITPWGTYEDFKKRFLNLDIKTPREKVHPLVWEDLPEKPEKIEPVEPGITSPISLIYNIFSKEGKAKRKYQKLQKKEAREKKIQSKFNREIVGNLTGLEGEKLDRFMEFCNFTDEYILNTKKYFILKRVKLKYKQFMKLDSLNSVKLEQK
ncbi:hypothetical protein AKJ55_00240 [candidate division MSBL1 archaeon SCGC-AAA382M17]|uniref:Carboxypeptidase-like regulatory domain-containing protein n=1 Tax=candidate division MSBL1 archaeon SCGC-AAA382M17 TaxID=1698284 RepID=A0ABR5TK06_9EURY|nr:hypothetical protein AKJ55_00240 [candidate division MSBL1 archaeon SCGC-AAA382M17]